MLIPRFVPLTDAANARKELGERIAAEVGYGVPAPESEHLYIQVPMRQLGPRPMSELWLATQAVRSRQHDEIRLAQAGEVLFGCADLPMSDAAGFEHAVGTIYRSISASVCAVELPYLHRVWNYFPGIHHSDGGLDRYQQFCRARQPPLSAHCRGLRDGFPAATAIGHAGAGGVVYFISGRRPGHHQENPRQVSAFDYPAQYGPQSPSFARATLVESGSASALYISGTASIVGHESRHQDDAAAQFQETVSNINEVMLAAAAISDHKLTGIDRLGAVKIYLRRVDDYDAVHTLAQSVFAGIPQMYIQGDLCRRELLLEIEAFAGAD